MEQDKYVLGFNHAYILMAKQPEVLGFLKAVKSESDYILGLNDGMYQYYVDYIETGPRKQPKKDEVEQKRR
jgi:hypothetical protein